VSHVRGIYFELKTYFQRFFGFFDNVLRQEVGVKYDVLMSRKGKYIGF
jgi:hypothetical protein